MNEFNNLNTNLKSNEEFNNLNTSISNFEYNNDTCKIRNSKFSINSKLISFFISTVVLSTVIIGVVFKHKGINIINEIVTNNSYTYKINNEINELEKDLFIFLSEKEDEKELDINDYKEKRKFEKGINIGSFYNLKKDFKYYLYIYSFDKDNLSDNYFKSYFKTKNDDIKLNIVKEIINSDSISLSIDVDSKNKSNFISQLNDSLFIDFNKDLKSNKIDIDNNVLFENLKENTSYYVNIYYLKNNKYDLLFNKRFITNKKDIIFENEKITTNSYYVDIKTNFNKTNTYYILDKNNQFSNSLINNKMNLTNSVNFEKLDKGIYYLYIFNFSENNDVNLIKKHKFIIEDLYIKIIKEDILNNEYRSIVKTNKLDGNLIRVLISNIDSNQYKESFEFRDNNIIIKNLEKGTTYNIKYYIKISPNEEILLLEKDFKTTN